MKLPAFCFLTCAAITKPIFGWVHDHADNTLILGCGAIWFFVCAFSACWLHDANLARLQQETLDQFRRHNPNHD